MPLSMPSVAARLRSKKPIKPSYRRPTVGILFVRNLPPRVKELFHATCVRRGDTMTDVMTCIMNEYILHPEKFPVSKYYRTKAVRALPNFDL